MTLQQITQEHGIMFQRFKDAKRKCLEPGSEINAINSHILQKNGVISHIQEENHVYQLHTNQITSDLSFRKTGVNNCFAFKGFCNHHDTAIFKQIEQIDFDINDYKSKLLLCYRGILNEQRKKEVLVDLHNSLIHSSKIKKYIDASMLKSILMNEKEAIMDFVKIATELRNDLVTGENNFYFSHKIVKQLKVCTSATFNVETRKELTKLATQNRLDERLNNLIVNILPYQGGTLILIGCSNASLSKCLRYFIDFNNDPIKFASDLLVKHIETWICSPTFYQEHIKPIEGEFLDEFRLYPTFKDYSEYTPINLFRNL